MEQERIYLTVEQVQDLWEENGDGTVHIQKNPQPGMFMGFDRDIESLITEMKEADAIEIGGENCMAMGHGILLFPKGAKYHHELVFIQHNKEKMALFLKEKNV